MLSAVVLVAILVTTGCGSSTQQQPVTRTSIVVDTDMSWDDITALVYLFERPDVDVKGIAVAGDGLTHCDPGVSHVRQLVAYLGHAAISVGCGREVPLQGSASFPAAWRQAADGFFGLTLPSVPEPFNTPTAVQVLDQALRASPTSVVVSLGPMTNLAETLTLHPDLVPRIRMVYAMAGAFDVPGNEIANGKAEWNIYVDPAAARILLASRVPVTLIPLDATDDVPVTVLFRDALKASRSTPASQLVGRLLSDPYYYAGGQYFWDPAAAVVATEPALARVATDRIAVVEDAGSDIGRTVRKQDGAPVHVTSGIDGAGFYREYLRVVLSDPQFQLAVPTSLLELGYSTGGWSVNNGVSAASGPVAIRLSNDTSSAVGFVVARIAPGHSVSDVDAAIAAKVTTPPDWFQILLQVTVPRDHPATWGVDLEPGLYVVIGGGPEVPLQRLAAISCP